MTNIGILHEPGHEEPWIIAMDCRPTRATVLDYSARWCIEPMFSDFKSNGFGLEDTRIRDPNRLDKLILIMALAIYWCVSVEREDAFNNRTPLQKKP
uniref:Transposase DDE domain-containing protein n=1 Tax=Candidatus Kentrum eta TaxID=2126337 RepID=A0A450VJP6_9GAMM|nr:MAG: Transposase DDE domain-containing protein [Candidatus Kentron sp. H]VFK05288.1 MAG: Transposase DDE domain-containing protein [Candidatus Kentron sp. H]VFK08652.1 MAG: Transposase DDE domain-containing protein [Candidatus Kentron sp. H]